MRDVAVCIAQVLTESRLMPMGPETAIRWALQRWPHATRSDASRAYEIAVEIYEDDYLFEQA